jgi:citrate synthase
MGDTHDATPPASRSAKGLADVVAASTAISDIDGTAGRLSYRGYDIHDLAGRTSFEEVAHLLQRGTLPTRAELAGYTAELAAARTAATPTVDIVLPAVAARCTPMEALRTLVSTLSADDPDAADNSPAANSRKAVRLVAQLPVLVARYHAARTGGALVDADPGLGTAAVFLAQITGRPADPVAVAALDECLVLHADHTMNASTFAARVCAATLSDLHSAVTAAIGTLKGALHGGANEAVMRVLQSLREPLGDDLDRLPDAVDASVRERLARGEKLMGFGHRVYRSEDPRATHLRTMSRRLGQSAADAAAGPVYHLMSDRMERTVFEVKGLRPNVDFYAASVYHSLGIPTDLFTPAFAVSRMAGWTAHVMEQQLDNRLIRPDSEYIGPEKQSWVSIEER